MTKFHLSARNIAVLILFLGLLLALRWAWAGLFPVTENPAVAAGVLDLRGVDLDQSSSLPLSGEWEFFPNKLFTYDEMDSILEEASFVQVPGDWRSAFPDEPASSFGYGTYRLRIMVDTLDKPVTFWLQKIEAASVIEMNGFTEGKAGEGAIGKPADNAGDYIPRRLSYTSTYLENGVQELVVLVRVANFDNPYQGGILHPIRFGTQAAIDYERWYSIGFQLVTFVVLLLHCLYACILYLLNRSERALLLFSLLTLAAGLSIVTEHDNLLMLWLPFDYAWASKIRIFSYLWTSYFLLCLCRSFSGFKQGRRWFWLFSAMVGAYSLFVALSPPALVFASMYKVNIFFVLYLGAFVWSVNFLVRRHRTPKPGEGTIFLLLSAAAIMSSVLWGLGIFHKVIPFPDVYYPIDMIAAIISFSMFWFTKYFHHSRENLKLNLQLQEADKRKDQFLTNTSHELRTPLHGLINIAESVLTQEKERMNEKSRKDMELLITISRRMSAMITDLLDAVQLREQRIKLKTKPLYIQSIVPGVVHMLGYLHEHKPIRMSVDIGHSIPAVMADEGRLVQILHNLVHNAIKFTERGTIAVTADKRGDTVWIHVSDTGIGIDAQSLSSIMLPYEQGKSGASDGGGIGLGLSICKQLIELHGGRFEIQSRPGVGSVFSFSLPIAGGEVDSPVQGPLSDVPDAARAELAAAAVQVNLAAAVDTAVQGTQEPGGISEGSASVSAADAIRIMAVDDDPVNLNVLKSILATEAYELTTADSADKAMQWLSDGQWDLLIVDVMMPGISGYELTRKVREQFSLSELPVLLLTARTQTDDIYAGFRSGANDYVAKPVDSLELKYRIRALTGVKQSVNELLRMEAAYLQAQIQPHFIFNTLNSIMALSLMDIEQMRKLGEAFATYLRISFDFLNTKQLVELSHELELVQAYLYVEQERFGNRLAIAWEIESHDLRIPPLSIQPLVENAVKHGLVSQLRGGTVLIRVVRQKNAVLIEVRDDGKGMDAETVQRLLHEPARHQGRSGIGLNNTNRRLNQLYGTGLTVVSKPGEGTSVSFSIPIP